MNYHPWPGIGLSETPIDWVKELGSATLSAKSTANVERRRKTGKDHSTFRGMSKKSDESGLRGAPKTMRGRRNASTGFGNAVRPESNSGRIRAALAHGPMSRAQICAATGVKATHIYAYLKNDLEKGRVIKIVKQGEYQKFALAEVA
ncbi:hypothetical protein [Variovorax boronicumulans]|uniref:hypothetical protein n=1 Tax=Variovorax boronicumulans TaxID=436515 RepID=UPI0012E4AB2A|nr:hypothetical protein [Variovorax boronicumulans]GER21280.1 hypothetical protein VCH24_63270 [Variovorax boronicumulans]